MAIAYTNHGATKTSSTAAKTTGNIVITAAAGDTTLVAVALAAGTNPSISDSNFAIYTLLVGPITNTDTLWLFGLLAANGGPNSFINVTWTTSSRYSVAIDTWSGVTGFGVTGSATGTSTSPLVVITLGQPATSWGAAAMLSAHTIATWSAAANNNLRQNIAGASTSTPGAALDEHQFGGSLNATLSLSKAWVALGLELQAVAAATMAEDEYLITGPIWDENVMVV